jgi:hypothetical protein
LAESDESGTPQTSPVPELNPLLNPILNKNLGRWAEVYFKCPPERRDEAVRQLLRDLESEQDAQFGAGTSPSYVFPHRDDPARNESTASLPEVQPLVCQSCGFAARPNQKFCGRCGERLVVPASSNDSRRGEESPFSPRDLGSERFRLWPSGNGPEPRAEANIAAEPDFSIVQQSAPLWYSYRFYIGTGLAIAVLVLGYLAWRVTQDAPAVSKRPEQAPSAAAAPSSSTPAAETATPEKSIADHSAHPPTSPAHVTESEIPPKPTGVQNAHPGTVNSNPGPAQAREENATPSPASSEQSLTGPASSAYGSQELATAQEFLTGSGGKQADSQQAVEWLWKSVAKRNTEATLLLARLYLRGDGVQKNCDQGRILLDIAARKGSKDAATLLQNLQAFGCP